MLKNPIWAIFYLLLHNCYGFCGQFDLSSDLGYHHISDLRLVAVELESSHLALATACISFLLIAFQNPHGH